MRLAHAVSPRLPLLLAALFAAAGVVPAAAIEVDASDFPLTVTGSGLVYDLVEDVVFSGTGIALRFANSADVVFRGNGHRITATTGASVVEVSAAADTRIERLVVEQRSAASAFAVRNGSTALSVESSLVCSASGASEVVRVVDGSTEIAFTASTVLHFGDGPAFYTRQLDDDTLRLHGCILQSRRTYAFQSLDNGWSGLEHSHNAYHDVEGTLVLRYAGESFTDPVLYEPTAIHGPPGFVEDDGTPQGDYRLADGSRALDRGDQGAVSGGTDLGGDPRVVGYDVDPGAFEHPTGATDFATLPGPIETEATFLCAGVRWSIDGDADLDCAVDVAFRPTGTSTWRPAQPLLRVEPGSFNDDGIDPGNLLAGSIFGLAPDTSYELRLTLADPDGGSAVEVTEVQTRAFPVSAAQERRRYVVPGTGGGSGTQADPFRGIDAADAAAAPGDLFLLAAGTYSGTQTLRASGTPGRPIVWRGVDPEFVVLDGEGLVDSLLVLEDVAHVQIERLTVTRPRFKAIYGTSTEDIVIRDCVIDCSELLSFEMWGIYLRKPGDHARATIVGNRVIGPLVWEDGRPGDDHYGIAVAGQGHVIAYNAIHGWYDGIRLQDGSPEIQSSGCDVYGNEIYDCPDDGIEADGSSQNVRVFENRVTNCLCGISCQPVYGGPVYVLRNVVYNFQLKPLKFQVWPTGMIVYHNTFAGAATRGWGTGNFRNTVAFNNLFVGGSTTNSSAEPIPIDFLAVRLRLDYNGWRQVDPGRFALFNQYEYATLAGFRAATGLEEHAVLVGFGDFVDAEEPPLGSYLGEEGYPPAHVPGDADLRLSPGSVAVDRGIALPNIADGFAGTAPDLGAYEFGLPVPAYGLLAGALSEVPEFGGADGDPSGSMGGSAPILSVAPHPAVGSVHFRLGGANRGAGRLSIYDVKGRNTREFSVFLEPGRAREVVWDGRDQSGAPVGAGVYFVELEMAGGRVRSRIVYRR